MAEALQGEVRLKDIDVSGKPSHVVERRSAVKLGEAPTIAVCMPIGDKGISEEGECPACKATVRTQLRRTQGMVPIMWASNHMQLVAPLNASMVYMFEFGRLAAEAREVLTRDALARGVKYIFYWDDDTLIPPLAIYSMHQYLESHPDVGAVTGVYTTREDNPEPVLYKTHGGGAYWDFQAGPNAEPEEVFSTGGGCLMVRADAIRKMTQPYWADGYENTTGEGGEEHRIVWGHDVRFCLKLKQEAGMPLYVMGSVLCGHYDAETGKVYVLPANSKPMRLWRVAQEQEYWSDVWGEGMRKFDAPEVYSIIANHVPLGSTVADLGCGTGLLVQQLTQERDCHAVGYDFSDQALSFARKLFLPVMELDLRNLTAEDIAGADVVTCTFTFEWVPPPVRERILEAAKDKLCIVAIDPKTDNLNKITAQRLKALMSKYFSDVRLEKVKGKVIAIGSNDGVKDPGAS